jgi:hypothetical protein
VSFWPSPFTTPHRGVFLWGFTSNFGDTIIGIDDLHVMSIIKISLASAPRESVALSKIENQLVKQITDCFF